MSLTGQERHLARDKSHNVHAGSRHCSWKVDKSKERLSLQQASQRTWLQQQSHIQ